MIWRAQLFAIIKQVSGALSYLKLKQKKEYSIITLSELFLRVKFMKNSNIKLGIFLLIQPNFGYFLNIATFKPIVNYDVVVLMKLIVAPQLKRM